MTDTDELEASLDALEDRLGGAQAVTSAFEAELQKMTETLAGASREVDVLSGGIDRGLRDAFEGLVFEGMKLSDALATVARSMVDAAYGAAIKPVTAEVGGLIAGGIESVMSAFLPFSKGAGFAQGRVIPFAQGGVVAGPTGFALRGARGLMGEAGPEAILPLGRGPDGRLGVQMSGGGGSVNVVVNVSTPDVEGFRRLQGQIAAQLGRLVARGQRNR